MTKQGQDTIKLAVIHQTNVSIFCCPHMEKKMKEEFLRLWINNPIHHLFGVLMDH
jgi:hypothetical protein